MKLDRSLLRYIAFVCMVLDHVAATLLPSGPLAFSFRIVGRIAFPVFCFFLVQGFIHTHSRKRYALRLLGLALLSQVPYTFCFLSVKLNVVFNLFAGLLLLSFLDHVSEACPRHLVFLFASLSLASLSEYGQMGIVVITTMYVMRDSRPYWYLFLTPVLFLMSVEYCGAAILALPLIACCSNEKGIELSRSFNYLFYPIHLAVFWFLQLALPLV